MDTNVRKVEQADIATLKLVIDSSELFPSKMLDNMISSYFNDPQSQDIWLTRDDQSGKPVAIVFCAPEKMTDGTYNLYLIAVDGKQRGRGIGAELMGYLEDKLNKDGVRVLIVETSGLPEFEQTRRFYAKLDYQQEAVIRDFYSEGEDKVVFWKKLN